MAGSMLSALNITASDTTPAALLRSLVTRPQPSFFAIIPALFVVYGIILVIYRLCISPLAGFPGPKIAAATAWYEFYYDVVKSGRYFHRIAEMHDEYGPLVRINPWELSVRDGDFHSTLYVAGSVRRSEIFPRSRAGIGIDGSHAVSKDHDLHRARRKPLDPFFSRRQVQEYEPMIFEALQLLESRLEALSGTGTIVNMEHVYAALSGDLIGKISVTDPPSFLSDPDFAPDWHTTLCRFFTQITLYTNFTFLMGWVSLIPRSVLLSLTPGAAGFKTFTELVIHHIEDAKKRRLVGEPVSSTRANTLAQHILASDLPESEKTTQRLAGEFIAILAGGTMTTARALATITYFVLADRRIEIQLREALAETMAGYPDKVPRWAELEKIPYLAACVKEGLRISHGSMRRVPRSSPDLELQYKQWKIPKGTPVGMSAFMMHTDPEVYPRPFEFIPERWLGDYSPLMNRNYIPFSKGSRNCLGMSFAYAELYMTVAVMFGPRGPKMSLFETDETDVIPVHDFFLAVPKLDSKGMRVVVE
ncbi:putative cytochrome P450 [Lasiosphaeria hispida]|uniref:Cytochrome P450 n=1 Tax=Lasiosphaeria hispida TaxID=260671 RepID=A0AAJ0MC64_9PEZI|nr:putative cytochrome P450 [Lasiosphaeria hispida]